MQIQMITQDDQGQKTAILKISGSKYSGAKNVGDLYSLNYGQYEQDPSKTILDCLNEAVPKLIKEME